MSVNRDGLVNVNPTSDGHWRRSVYVQYRRTEIPSMLETFDYPEMGPNCVARTVSIVSPQLLMMMNNEHVRELANAFANRVQAILSGQDSLRVDPDAAQVDTVYQLALNRLPSDVERRIGIESLNQLQTEWKGNRHAALDNVLSHDP